MAHIGIDLGSKDSPVRVRTSAGELLEEPRCHTDQLGGFLTGPTCGACGVGDVHGGVPSRGQRPAAGARCLRSGTVGIRSAQPPPSSTATVSAYSSSAAWPFGVRP